MKRFSPSYCVIMVLACGVPQHPSTHPAPQREFGLGITYDRTIARVTLDIVRPGYLIVVEQSSDGFLPLFPFDTTSSTDWVPAGVYRFNVVRQFAVAPPAFPSLPNPPCLEFRPSDNGMQAVWTGFCGLSQALAATSRTTVSAGFAPLPEIHRVLVLQFADPMASDSARALLDSLPWSVSPEMLLHNLRSWRVAPGAFTWIAVLPRGQE